jgi:hypothetical protein
LRKKQSLEFQNSAKLQRGEGMVVEKREWFAAEGREQKGSRL